MTEITIDKHNKTEISKKERINAELDRISNLFEQADGNQRAAVSSLIQNAAFMKVTLEDLQEIINKEGVTETYQNGANQHGVKQSATLQSYNSLIKNYASVIKSLSSILPRESKREVFQPLSFEPIEKTLEEIEEERRRDEEHLARINAEIAAAAEYQRKQREGKTNQSLW